MRACMHARVREFVWVLHACVTYLLYMFAGKYFRYSIVSFAVDKLHSHIKHL